MPLYQVVQTTRPQKTSFHVVIIDEASQSGPEALLLNYIADKLIVVGDDKQITPMHVGVDRSAVEFLQRKYLKDIPHPQALDLEGSLFSQAELRFPDRIRLREHFRCMPEIIQFSNNLSYTTEPLIPLRQYGADRLEPLRTVFVKDGYRKGSSEDIVNPSEAEAIVAQIGECCENPSYAGKTFGVICLKGGNRQADLITNLLVKEIGAEEMERRRIVCGRAYDFQGDERDVMFLGLVDAPSDGMLRSDMSNPDVQRRYNVAASRARDQLWVFHSMSLNDLRPGSYQYRLLEYCQNPTVRAQGLPFDIAELGNRRRDVRPPEPFESWFEVDVFLQVHAKGFRVLPQYEVATYRIDLVVEGLKGRLAVECDGDEWHGPDRYESDMARQRDLERCGWVFWRVRGSDFYRDTTAALVELWETLERLKISPCQAWESDRRRSEKESTTGELIPNSDTVAKNHGDLEDDTEVDEDEEEQESQSTENAGGRLNRVLGHTRSHRRRPEEMPPLHIQNAILQSLQKCPNHSCTLKSLTSRVLKELGVSTRGNPRLEFEKRVLRNLGALKRKEFIEEYKAKNKRIRLLVSPQGTMLFQ
jgi:very-short-patch-repair endonuclease